MLTGTTDEDVAQLVVVSPAEKQRLLRRAVSDCQRRGLWHSASWAAELVVSLRELVGFDSIPRDAETPCDDLYALAKSYFDLKEYLRAAHALRASVCARQCFSRSPFLLGSNWQRCALSALLFALSSRRKAEERGAC